MAFRSSHQSSAPPVSSAGELIDVLKVLELSEDMEGVSLEAGLCTSREGQELSDLAFKIDKKIQLSAPTRQFFPGRFLSKLGGNL